MNAKEDIKRIGRMGRAAISVTIASVVIFVAVIVALIGVALKGGAIAMSVVSTLLVDGFSSARRIARQFKEIRLF